MVRITYLFLTITLLLSISCSKEDPNFEIVDNECSEIIEFRKKVDFLELFGEELAFTNINTGEEKIFSYNAQSSNSTVVNQTILCTKLQYEDNVTLVFKTANGTDRITYVIKQFLYNGEFELVINQPIINFDGVEFNNLFYIEDNTFIANITESDKRLVYLKENKYIQAVDDLNGNQWLLNGENKNIFFCEVKNNFNAFRTTPEFSSFLNLASNELNYNDGLLPTLSFKRESQNIFHSYQVETNNSCDEEQLVLNENTTLQLSFRFSSFYSMNINYNILYKTIGDDQYSNFIDIVIYHSEVGDLHRHFLIQDELEQYDKRSFIESDFILHEEITLSNISYDNVYEFASDDRKLYFNLSNGVIAFTDHLGDLNFMVSN